MEEVRSRPLAHESRNRLDESTREGTARCFVLIRTLASGRGASNTEAAILPKRTVGNAAMRHIDLAGSRYDLNPCPVTVFFCIDPSGHAGWYCVLLVKRCPAPDSPNRLAIDDDIENAKLPWRDWPSDSSSSSNQSSWRSPRCFSEPWITLRSKRLRYDLGLMADRPLANLQLHKIFTLAKRSIRF